MIALAAAILAATLALLGLVAARVPHPHVRPLALGTLHVVGGGPPISAPAVLLYVDRRCSHCRTAAARLDSVGRATGARAVLVAGEPSDSAGALVRYGAALGLRATLALDTGHVLARAAGVQAVPVLLFVDRAGAATLMYGVPRSPAVAALLRP
jgi:hypothetical protein